MSWQWDSRRYPDPPIFDTNVLAHLLNDYEQILTFFLSDCFRFLVFNLQMHILKPITHTIDNPGPRFTKPYYHSFLY